MSNKAYVRDKETNQVLEVPINEFTRYRARGHATATRAEFDEEQRAIRAAANADADKATQTPTDKPLEEMTIPELRKEAKAAGLDITITKDTKDDAIAAITEARENADPEEPTDPEE